MYQFTIDDMEQMKSAETLPSRTAFIDECGSFGFDFLSVGNSKYYVVCAVCVPDSKIAELECSVEAIRRLYFGKTSEMKSSILGSDYKRRNKVISALLPLEFRVVVLVADKQAFMDGTALTSYKKTFIKYLHQRLYKILYHVYPKLKIVEDATGTSEFQAAFKKYVESNRPQENLLNDYDFSYVDSKESILVQLADIIAGTIAKFYSDEQSTNYLEILGKKIIQIDEFPSKRTPYFGTTSPKEIQYNEDIFNLSVKCANDFIAMNEETDNFEKRLQVAFLQYLLFQAYNVSASQFVSSKQLVSVLSEYAEQKIRPNYLYRRIVAQLREAGVILSSSAQGYKIPTCMDDIVSYMNQTNLIVSPMLHRMEICRKLIFQQTDKRLDIFDDIPFIKYKKLFDE